MFVFGHSSRGMRHPIVDVGKSYVILQKIACLFFDSLPVGPWCFLEINAYLCAFMYTCMHARTFLCACSCMFMSLTEACMVERMSL